MTRARFTITAIVLGLLTTMASTSVIGAEAKSAKSKCMRLKGKDRAPARKVKLVTRDNAHQGRDLVGCVLPRGRVFTVASSDHDDEEEYRESSTYSLLRVKSSTVLVRTITSNGGFNTITRETIFSLRTGKSELIADACATPVDACPPDPPTSAPVVLINKHGRAVVAQHSGAPPTTTSIFGFSSRGKRVDLDSGPFALIPPASLKLLGDVVSWTNTGQARSAVLTE